MESFGDVDTPGREDFSTLACAERARENIPSRPTRGQPRDVRSRADEDERECASYNADDVDAGDDEQSPGTPQSPGGDEQDRDAEGNSSSRGHNAEDPEDPDDPEEPEPEVLSLATPR